MATKKERNLQPKAKRFIVKKRKPGETARQQLAMYGTTRTQQQFKDDCDINLIMAKYIKTGVLDHQREHGAEYGFASSDTFRDSMEIVSKANSMFEDLPSSIRSKFENNPAKFLDFVQDPKNLKQMQEMGLANKSNPPETPLLPNNGAAVKAEGLPSPGAPVPANDRQDVDRRITTPAAGTPAGVEGSD